MNTTIKTEENSFKIVRTIDNELYSSENIYPTVEMKIDSNASLSDVLYAFEGFLKASGYFLPENTSLDFVEI